MSEVGRPKCERDLSRANWQRGAGAIAMRELTEGAFDDLPAFTTEASEEIWQQAYDRIYLLRHEGLSLLWSGAYKTSQFIVDSCFNNIFENLEIALSRDVNAHLKTSFGEYTYEDQPKATMTESKDTLTHSPITLARSICAHARVDDKSDSDRFRPQTLNDIAALLESSDFKAMVDDAMFTANGFWKGFSTSINSLATTGMMMKTYDFDGGEVRFTNHASKQLKKVMRANNKTGNNYYGYGKSTSGCPAQHERPSEPSISTQEIDSLNIIFNKPTEELLAKHDSSVAQEGLSYLARGLRANSSDFEQRLIAYAAKIDVPAKMPKDYLTHP